MCEVRGEGIYYSIKWRESEVAQSSHSDPTAVVGRVPLSMGFSRQEYWSGLPFSSPGNLPNPGMEPRSPALQAESLLPVTLLGFPAGSDCKESACHAGDLGLIPGSGRYPGEGNGYPLLYSGLENFVDRGTWRAIVHGAVKSRTTEQLRLSLSL